MYGRFIKITFSVLLATVSFLYSTDELKILALRVDFPADSRVTTTGDGKFLLEESFVCDNYTVDPPPHDKSYFESHLNALDNYYSSVSNGNFGIDLINSIILPLENNNAYKMPNEMAYYHPALFDLSEEERATKHEELLVELFSDALQTANSSSTIEFNNYDLVVVIHAGVGQDFDLGLEDAIEDIPSTFVDRDMIQNKFGLNGLSIGGVKIQNGIIIPETQNHIYYKESAEHIRNTISTNICNLQYGLTGTFAIYVGQAIGLPPLWNTNSGDSGVGVFGLMDVGSNNSNGLIPAPPSAWNRIFMGWEEAETIIPDKVVDVVSRPNGKIFQVDIDNDEYYLIENRTNWFRTTVDIDSVQRIVYSRVDTIPNLIEIIFDSVGVEIDENGVVVSVPDYDIGLQGSGLLIWHIDESIIAKNIDTYSINNDVNNKGVDLEEASGSQNIGFTEDDGTHGITGEYFDLWFQGNWLFEENNSLTKGNPLEFNSMTYPNTNSNNGALSNIKISHIGYPSDTMQISISNNFTLSGFPDTSLHILYHTDFTRDGNNILIGGEDKLWWSYTDNIDKNYFYELPSDINLFTVTNLNNKKNFVVLSNLSDSSEMVWFEFDNGFIIKKRETLDIDWDSISHLQGSLDSDNVDIIVDESAINLQNLMINSSVSVKTPSTGGVIIGDLPLKYSEIQFEYISAIDLDLDGTIEVLAVDNNGKLYAFNQNYTNAIGFPIDNEAIPTILSKNIIGDDKPEIVFQNSDGEILILNNVGEQQYKLANPIGSKLLSLSEYKERNTIITESTIWVFDKVKENGGNQWTSHFGDEINSNSIAINYSSTLLPSNGLIDKKQTYVYPNPVKDGIAKIRMFNNSAEKIEIKIYDSAGYFVDEINSEINIINGVWETVWDVSNVESGIYLLKLIATNNKKSDSVILKVGVIH